jgi:tRNA(Ile)-lysidine synthase TilS/MesJ
MIISNWLFSGGKDSTVLFHLINEEAKKEIESLFFTFKIKPNIKELLIL